MSKLLIRVMSGNETQADCSCKAYVYYCPPDDGKEVILNRASEKMPSIIEKVGNPMFTPAVNGMDTRVCGQWITQSFNIEEGTIIKVAATRKQGWNSLLESAQIYLRIRAQAAHRRIEVDTIAGRKSSRDKLEFQGRFDILDPDDVFAEANIEVPNHFKKFHTPTNRNRLFREVVLDAEKRERQKLSVVKVSSEDGTEVVLKTRKRSRRLKFSK